MDLSWTLTTFLFGSIVSLMLSFVLGIACLFIAAAILKLEGSTLGKAFAVSLVSVIASFAGNVFFIIDSFFTTVLAVAVTWVAAKEVYKTDWINSFFLLLIAFVILTLASMFLFPLVF